MRCAFDESCGNCGRTGLRFYNEMLPTKSSATKELGEARAQEIAPIPLNAAQEQAAKEWATDDRLWTTQETVEFNLRTFARVVLAAHGREPAQGDERPPDYPWATWRELLTHTQMERDQAQERFQAEHHRTQHLTAELTLKLETADERVKAYQLTIQAQGREIAALKAELEGIWASVETHYTRKEDVEDLQCAFHELQALHQQQAASIQHLTAERDALQAELAAVKGQHG